MKPQALQNAAAARARDSLGCALGQLGIDQRIEADGLTILRKATRGNRLAQVQTPPSGRGCLVGVSLGAGVHRRRILHGAGGASFHFHPGSVYVRHFADDYRADLYGDFDFVLFELSTAFLDRIADGGAGGRGLVNRAGEPDPVLQHLGRALLPVLERPADAGALFIDHLGFAIGTHLLRRYGGREAEPPAPQRRTLSRAHERRAKELMVEHLAGNVSVAEIALACDISRGHFIRAFRETTGLTPHQWLVRQRLERARELLRTSTLGLAEVAAACGFADQSHLTRVFAQAVGTTPGRWRRLMQD